MILPYNTFQADVRQVFGTPTAALMGIMLTELRQTCVSDARRWWSDDRWHIARRRLRCPLARSTTPRPGRYDDGG